MIKNCCYTLLFLLSFCCFGQDYNESVIQDIQKYKIASEGDLYKDITNDIQYIGASDGSLKILITQYAKVISKVASYTLRNIESGMVFTFNSVTDVTLTVPAGLPIGTNISIYQLGAGVVTIIPGTGVTLNHRLNFRRTAGLHAGVGVLSTAQDVYHLTGDLTN